MQEIDYARISTAFWREHIRWSTRGTDVTYDGNTVETLPTLSDAKTRLFQLRRIAAGRAAAECGAFAPTAHSQFHRIEPHLPALIENYRRTTQLFLQKLADGEKTSPQIPRALAQAILAAREIIKSAADA